MNTFSITILIFALSFSSFSLGVISTSEYYIRHLGTDITEDLKYERETCTRSEPKYIPCKITFVKEINNSNEG